MKKSDKEKIEYWEKTEDGSWCLALKEPWVTEYDTVSIFGDTKQECIDELKYVKKDPKYDK